ncbi:RNA polymerase sigma factor [Algoriphagus formosus]|uniref:RNA polymerase sigma factor n=1 Tax=Algoriphagus formosus TaxID=2007308 RepID=UPI001E4158D6|nr:sigma-70 region 4 domain-containing protein [Algoriphagus formosus]
MGLSADFECLLNSHAEKQKKYESNELSPGDQKEENAASISDESLNQLYTAIRELSEIDRAVILLYLEEKSYQEIAQIMGTNPNNIEKGAEIPSNLNGQPKDIWRPLSWLSNG